MWHPGTMCCRESEMCALSFFHSDLTQFRSLTCAVHEQTPVCEFNSIQVYLYSAFHNTNHGKAALQKNVSFYNIFSSSRCFGCRLKLV